MSKVTVAELLVRWLASTKPRTAGRTHEDRQKVCDAHVTPHVGCFVVSKLTALQVEGYYATLRNEGVA
jgi:hypothetical protein